MIAWVLMAVNGAALLATGQPLMNEVYMMFLIAVVGWACFVHQLYYTFADFKRILNIEIYRIKAKKI